MIKRSLIVRPFITRVVLSLLILSQWLGGSLAVAVPAMAPAATECASHVSAADTLADSVGDREMPKHEHGDCCQAAACHCVVASAVAVTQSARVLAASASDVAVSAGNALPAAGQRVNEVFRPPISFL